MRLIAWSTKAIATARGSVGPMFRGANNARSTAHVRKLQCITHVRGNLMRVRYALLLTTLLLAVSPPAQAQEGAAAAGAVTGAVAGALVGGPIGAVLGGLLGAAAGQEIARAPGNVKPVRQVVREA